MTKTNEITGEITPPKLQQVVTPEITSSYAPPTLITNLVPRPLVEEALKTTGALPFPFAGAVALLLGWAYSGYAAMRNKRLGVAVIQSVQAGREFLQSTPEGKKLDEQFKATLAQHQTYSGVVKEVKQLLDRYVDKT